MKRSPPNSRLLTTRITHKKKMTTRAVTYTRFSSDRQNTSSIEDQERNCRRYAKAHGLQIIASFSDEAISGARHDRPGYQTMLDSADAGLFNVLLVDDLSRLSRDEIELKRTIQRLKFKGIRIVGVSDGTDSDDKGYKLHAGVRGLLNEVYLDDLREKTHRGQSGQVLRGFTAGARPYGYRSIVVEDNSRTDTHGRPAVLGYRLEIDEEQAEIVREIYRRFATGDTIAAIVNNLNERAIPSPRNSTWARSAIYGHAAKGTGILNNQIYQGRYIWNRSRWEKDPDTGRRRRIERPREEWMIQEMPELRIIDAELWDAVQDMRDRRGNPAVSAGIQRAWRARGGRRPGALLTGLMQCGVCGGMITSVTTGWYGCSQHKERGPAVCTNNLRAKREVAEPRLLSTIKDELLSDDAAQKFSEHVRELLRERTAARSKAIGPAREKLRRAERELENIMQAIKAGVITPTIKEELLAAERRKASAQAEIDSQSAQLPPLDIDRILQRYRDMVRDLEQTLSAGNATGRARELLSQLLGSHIIVQPNKRYDCLEALIPENKQALLLTGTGPAITMVAGAGFEPTTFGL